MIQDVPASGYWAHCVLAPADAFVMQITHLPDHHAGIYNHTSTVQYLK